jgi:hypothetical protein
MNKGAGMPACAPPKNARKRSVRQDQQDRQDTSGYPEDSRKELIRFAAGAAGCFLQRRRWILLLSRRGKAEVPILCILQILSDEML